MVHGGPANGSRPPPGPRSEPAEPWLGPLLAMLVVQTAVSFLSRIPPTLAPTLAPRVGWPAESVGYLSSLITGGSIIVRQRGTPLKPGKNVGVGKDDTLFAKVTGVIKFEDKGRSGRFVSVTPVEA